MKICDNCHERPATNHITSIVDTVSNVRDLCGDGVEAFETTFAKNLATSMRGALCQFCGSPATIGTLDHLALATGKRRMLHLYLCFDCSGEFSRYTRHAIEQLPKGLSQHEQLKAIRQLRTDAEQHMKQWVSNRPSQ